VLELCRIIAGPTITRILGEYGAEVIKVTSPNLSDVPFFQVDGNMGKRATDLDLKTPEGRETFEKLLAEADVVVDGYRPEAIAKLGYGPQQLAELASKRGKGFVYVNENCFGYEGEWSNRAGWQQIADCVRIPLSNKQFLSRHSLTGRLTGYGRCVGARQVHGPRRAHGATVSHFRLRHWLHRCNHSSRRALPPGNPWWVMAW
jgi:hypothetical protein